MKKKIINGILLVALVFATSSAFVSCKDNDADVNTELLGQIKSLKAELEAVKNSIPTIPTPTPPYDDTAVKNAINDLNGKIQALEDQINNLNPGSTYDDTELRAAIETLQAEIDILEAESKALAASLSGFVYGINAEGSYNPVFGALAAPLGTTSHILAAYYGEGSPISFHGEKIKDYFTKDAGTIYFTVNPTEAVINSDGLTLVNSRDEASKVTLKAAESDKLLTWGWKWTRNSAGLYAADVIVDDLEAVKFDYSDIAHFLKEAIQKRTTASIVDLVGELLENVIGDKFPRLALKYTTNDDVFGTRSVRTGYDYGITAIKPLSYDFDVHIDKTPGLDRIAGFINKMIDKIQFDFPQIDVSNLHFEITGMDVGNRIITITVPAQIVTASDGVTTVTIPAQTFNYNMRDVLQEFYDDELAQINADLSSVNDILKEIDKINDFSVSFDNAKQDIKSELLGYLKKFDKLFVKYVNSTNKALQPTLLVWTKEDIRRAGNCPAGKVKLMPTSYTAEIIAPALKKFVKVECDGKEITGENLGKVIDGTVCEIEMEVEAGKTYKVTYDAVDFFGKVRSNTYYIKGI
jgi:hypothetical protein